MDRNPYSPPASVTEVVPGTTAASGPAGLAGWLVLVCLGLIVTPIRLAVFLLQTYPPIFRDGTWQRITTPGAGAYHPVWGPLLVFEIIINAAFIATSIYLLFLFFQRSWRFPGIYVAFLVVNLLFMFADALAVHFILPGRPLFDSESGAELGRAILSVVIWVPYMFLSRRVKNTFVRTS